MKRTIVHLVQSLHTGGTEHVLLKTLPLLSAFEHEVVTLKEPGELAPAFARKGIKVTTLDGRNLAQFVASRKPVLIMTHMFHADLAGRLLLRGLDVPIISSLVSTYNFPRYWPARLFERLTWRWAGHYFANSEAVRDFYVSRLGVASDKITVIHNGIDVSLHDRATGRSLVRELRLPPKRMVITCVANFAVNKGHRYLLEAFEAVFRRHPEVFLLLVGEGPERTNLERQIEHYRSKKGIKFLGRRADVPEILAATDLFVLPTLFEGLSNAILEAMAAKCAVITTDIPENRVMIKHSQTGILVPTRDAKALATAIETLIEDKQKRVQLGNNARQFILDHFDLRTIANQLDQAMKSYAKS